MIRCPICRSKQIEVGSCARCESDLTKLIEVEQAADDYIAKGLKAIKRGDYTYAEVYFQKANRLKQSAFIKQVLGFVSTSRLFSGGGSNY